MITQLLFDLDNTLYSARWGLEDGVSRRIREYMAAYLALDVEEALRQRRARRDYGSTLEWLMGEKGFTDVEGYYAAVHPPDEADSLGPDRELRDFLAGLALPLAILTNSPREHTDRILGRLGIGDLFPRIFDIRWNGFRGKPRREAFCRALEALGTLPENTLFIDDIPSYVEGYRALGGPGLLLDELGAHPEYPPPRIAHLRELTGFLR